MEAVTPAVTWRREWPVDVIVLAAVVVLGVANGLLWAFTIPFNEGPDEAAHFLVVRFIVDHGRLPVFSPDELWLLNTSKGFVESYAPFPPLAYVVDALAVRATNGTMWGARLVSVACYVLTVTFTFLGARRLAPNARAVAVSAALVVAFLPQFAFTGAYVNNDAFGVAITGLLVYLLLRVRDSPSAWLVAAVGVAAGALLLTKYTFYPVALVAVAAAAWRSRRPTHLALLLCSVAVSSGWWFARNWALYGEVIPVHVIADAKAAAGGNTLFVPAEYGITLLDISTRTDFWWATFTSFTGKFGFLTIELNPGYYLVCLGLLALAIVGGLARPFSSRRGDRDLTPFFIGTAMIIATALFAMASSAYGEYSPQGRYLFGALVPIAIGLAVSWNWLGGLTPVLRLVLPIATLTIVALNFVALFGYLLPAYVGDFPEGVQHIIVQVDPRLAGDRTQLAGWALDEGDDGLWFPYVTRNVELYRRPVSGVGVYADAPPPEGSLLGVAQYGIRRPDVDAFYGAFRRIENVGFALDLPPESSQVSAIYVCASSRGQIACVPASQPTGS
jgi:4-amino-4-deoxy-L-arabinose transferase-like glycosyltransferase